MSPIIQLPVQEQVAQFSAVVVVECKGPVRYPALEPLTVDGTEGAVFGF
jgi:hypothetical protein